MELETSARKLPAGGSVQLGSSELNKIDDYLKLESITLERVDDIFIKMSSTFIIATNHSLATAKKD